MRTKHRTTTRWVLLLGAAGGWACADAPSGPVARGPTPGLETTKFWDDLASTRWNDRAAILLQGRASLDSLPLGVSSPPNGQAWASRMLTYLSIAQYRAARAAVAADVEGPAEHPLVSSAVAGASLAVLEAFFGTAPGMRPELSPIVRQQIHDFLSREFAADARAPGFVEAGSQVGREVAAAVVAQAAADGYFPAATLPALNTTSGHWVPNGPIVRSLYGVKPFFLAEGDLMQSPPPPTGADLEAAAAYVYTVVTVLPLELRSAQVATANKWNKIAPAGPFTPGEWNRVAVALIDADHRTELDAARILANANAAAFDAQIDCFTTKFKWWVPRPAQVDGSIAPLIPFPTPNHPSYPSGHSCVSSAFGAMLGAEFPLEKATLDAMVEEAGWSRIYAGIHYVVDVEEGQQVGKRAAAKARAGSLE
jgi:membrane-associated phospholipid phosphatase